MKRIGSGTFDNIRFALGAMRDQKLRSALTLTGIVAGVAAVIMMVSFVVGFDRQVTSAFTAYGSHLVQFQKYAPRFGNEPPEEERNRRDLTIEDAEALKRLSKLARAVSQERYLFRGVSVRAGRNESNGAVLFGTNPDYAEANVHFTQDGRFISDSDVRHAARVCVIGPDTADTLFPLQDPIGRTLTIDGRAYAVVGLFEQKGGGLFGGGNNSHVAIPVSAFDEQYPEVKNGHGDTIHIATVPRRPEDFDALIEEETAILRARRGLRPGQPNDFALFTSVGQLRQFQQVSNGVAAAMLVIAAIALVVGGVGVMNIMLINVTQRTREIGLRKALGATGRDIAQQFLTEAVTLTTVGGALGIGLGLGVAFAVRSALDFQAAAPPWSVALGFGVSTAVGLISGLWPAIKAAHQDPIEALRYE
ncbi:MAG: ABC transporter permease [Acidobacteriota bacterium]